MAIGKLSPASTGTSNHLISRVFGGSGRSSSEVFRKHFGEAIPKIVDISHDPKLMAIFSQLGMVGRLQRKLRHFSRKKGLIVPAKGTVASALSGEENDTGEDLVFLGIDFAAEYQNEEETIAGVLAHEWGHLVSEFPHGLNPDDFNWEEIFELRKDEEAAADSYAGRMLFLMGYSPKGLIRFLAHPKNKKETPKYYSVETRGEIIQRSHDKAKNQQEQIQRIQIVPNATFRNPFATRLIAVA